MYPSCFIFLHKKTLSFTFRRHSGTREQWGLFVYYYSTEC